MIRLCTGWKRSPAACDSLPLGCQSARKPIPEAVEEYLLACEVEGKSPRTTQAYAETLRGFRRIMAAQALPTNVGAFRAAHIYQFLKGVADSGVSRGTRHRRFRETRAFFSWCTRMGYCARNPFAGIPNVTLEQKVIQPYTEGRERAATSGS